MPTKSISVTSVFQVKFYLFSREAYKSKILQMIPFRIALFINIKPIILVKPKQPLTKKKKKKNVQINNNNSNIYNTTITIFFLMLRALFRVLCLKSKTEIIMR